MKQWIDVGDTYTGPDNEYIEIKAICIKPAIGETYMSIEYACADYIEFQTIRWAEFAKRFPWIIALFLVLAGCTTRYDAEVAAANADSVRSQAVIVQAQEQARMFQQLAESAKPVYWPIVALAILSIVALLLVVRWHMITISHVAARQPMCADQLRLLPGDTGFNRALRIAAARRGARPMRSGGCYYLVDADGQRTQVRQLTVREDA